MRSSHAWQTLHEDPPATVLRVTEEPTDGQAEPHRDAVSWQIRERADVIAVDPERGAATQRAIGLLALGGERR
jgi:hypothetical protein